MEILSKLVFTHLTLEHDNTPGKVGKFLFIPQLLLSFNWLEMNSTRVVFIEFKELSYELSWDVPNPLKEEFVIWFK